LSGSCSGSLSAPSFCVFSKKCVRRPLPRGVHRGCVSHLGAVWCSASPFRSTQCLLRAHGCMLCTLDIPYVCFAPRDIKGAKCTLSPCHRRAEPHAVMMLVGRLVNRNKWLWWSWMCGGCGVGVIFSSGWVCRPLCSFSFIMPTSARVNAHRDSSAPPACRAHPAICGRHKH
jgi:hypothetical protein